MTRRRLPHSTRHASGRFERLVLAACRPVHPLLRAYGVDVEQFRVLLSARLRETARARDTASPHPGVFGLCGLLALMSLFVGFLASGQTPFYAQVFLQGFAFLYLVFAMAVDGSQLLVERGEPCMVASGPVHGRTIAAARLAHVASFLGLLLVSMSLLPLLIGLRSFSASWWIPVHVASSLLVLLLSMFVVVIAYGVALRVVGAARFRSVTSWIQLGMMTVFYVGYWGVRPLAEATGWGTPTEESALWLAAPPAWFGGLAMLASGEGFGIYWVHAALAVGVPLAAGAVGFALVRSDFLQALVARDGGRAAVPSERRGLLVRIESLVCGSHLERAGFRFFCRMAPREHCYRLRVGPSLVMIPLMIVFSMAKLTGHDDVIWALPIYGLVILGLTAAEGLGMSDDHHAAWRMRAAPATDLGPITVGAVKAVLMTTVALPGLVVVAFLALFTNPATVLHGVLALAVSLLLATITARAVVGRSLPFAAQPRKSADGVVVGLMFFMMFFVGAIGFAHYLLSREPTAAWIVGGLAALGLVVAWRRLARWSIPVLERSRAR